MSKNNNDSWLNPILHFGTHSIVGSLIFCIITGPAIGLSFLVEYFKSIHVLAFTVEVLSFLEHVLLIVDATLFVVYIIFTAYKAIKEIIK